MDLSLRLRECLIRASVYREEAGLAGLEAGTGEGGGTLGSRGGVCLRCMECYETRNFILKSTFVTSLE